ncbi:MAG: hypothetical protein KBA06_00170, partial [Saprospiraceae bacterium]|nr:hypothetical protein [Saprospiraceae bacterium]
MRVFTRLLLLFMLFNTIVATSQSTLTIGSSTSTFETTSAGAATATSTVPISSCWGYSYTQQIYTKAELNAAGMPSTGSQTINAIRFYYVGNSATSNSTTNSSNWTVYLSHTAGTSVGTAFLTAGLTQVFSGTVSFPSTGGWVTIPCSGFDYNNTDNLVVSVDENQASYDCSIFFRNTDVASTNNTYYRNDTNNPSPTSPPTGTTTNDRANIQIDYTGLVPCSGTPAPGNTVSSANPICSGTSITLSLQNSTAGSGITYQWQSSPDGSTWSDISGANSAYYSTTQSVATYYRCNVTCSGNTGASTALQVTMNPFMNCYCVTTPSTVNGVDIITGVSVGAYSNSSNGNDADNYISVNNTPPNLQLSGTYSGSITYGTDATQYGAAWIDWNQNGTFEASENIYLSSSSSGASTTVTFSFTVPAGATLGNTKIRFRGGSDSAYTTGGACTTSSFGETEDYLVNIVAATCTSPTVSAATVVPNCGSNQWSYT